MNNHRVVALLSFSFFLVTGFSIPSSSAQTDVYQEAVTSAWNSMFKKDNSYYLPDTIKQYDPTTLPSVSNKDLPKHFSSCEMQQVGTTFHGKAKISLSSMKVYGFSKMQRNGNPSFDDSKITFPMKFSKIKVTGDAFIDQPCCEGTIRSGFTQCTKTRNCKEKCTSPRLPTFNDPNPLPKCENVCGSWEVKTSPKISSAGLFEYTVKDINLQLNGTLNLGDGMSAPTVTIEGLSITHKGSHKFSQAALGSNLLLTGFEDFVEPEISNLIGGTGEMGNSVFSVLSSKNVRQTIQKDLNNQIAKNWSPGE